MSRLPNAKRPAFRWYAAMARLVIARLLEKLDSDEARRMAAMVGAVPLLLFALWLIA